MVNFRSYSRKGRPIILNEVNRRRTYSHRKRNSIITLIFTHSINFGLFGEQFVSRYDDRLDESTRDIRSKFSVGSK